MHFMQLWVFILNFRVRYVYRYLFFTNIYYISPTVSSGYPGWIKFKISKTSNCQVIFNASLCSVYVFPGCSERHTWSKLEEKIKVEVSWVTCVKFLSSKSRKKGAVKIPPSSKIHPPEVPLLPHDDLLILSRAYFGVSPNASIILFRTNLDGRAKDQRLTWTISRNPLKINENEGLRPHEKGPRCQRMKIHLV